MPAATARADAGTDAVATTAPGTPGAPIALSDAAAAADAAGGSPGADPAGGAAASDAAAAPGVPSDGGGAVPPSADSGAPLGPVAELRARIVGHRAEGSLCPSASAFWLVEEDSGHFTMQLGAELDASAADITAPLLASCTLTVDLVLPAGVRMGNPEIGYMPAVVGSVQLTTHYTFTGGGSTSEQTRELHEDSAFAGKGDDVWSPPCTDAQHAQQVQLVIELQANVSVGSYLGAFTMSSDFSYEGGADFASCAGGSTLVADGAGPGGRCATHPNYPCASGLDCDLLDDRTNSTRPLTEGKCVDRNERLAPQPLDGACGGVRDVPCQTGLVCHYISSERAALKPVGICAKSAPSSDERCGGAPELVCTAGLYCGTLSRASDAMYCQQGGGEEGARCGEGLAACAKGLVCNGETCGEKLAARGERCGEGVAGCGHLDLCDVRKHRCVASPAAGTVGARCIADDECNVGLVCLQALCTQQR